MFPFGAAPAMLLALALVALAARAALIADERSGPSLVMWSHAEPHLKSYESVARAFEEEHGVRVELRNVHWRVIDERLRSAMWAGRGVPDLVEVPLEKVGSFFRGPQENIGFEDLRPRLEDIGPSGLRIADDVVTARVRAYEHRGGIYGFPHDVHPTAIAYRWRDFEAAGIDPATLTTWNAFIDAGRRLTRTERTPGAAEDDRRYMLAIDEITANTFQTFLLQRGGDWFDREGNLLLDGEPVAETLAWYVRMCYGPGRIADGAAPFPNASFFQAIKSGYYVCFICPDWLTKNIEDNLPGFAGELRLMPMPAFEPGGRRTSTWGATMLSVTTANGNADLAWELAKAMYTSGSTARVTFAETNIVSPFRSTWDDPVFAEPRAYWGGQAIGELYLSLADEVPTLVNGPFVPLVQQRVTGVLAECAGYYRQRGEDGFEAFVRARLAAAAGYVREQMARNPF